MTKELHRFNPVHPDAMVSEQDGTHVLYSEVEPLEAENANLRALVQVLVDGMAGHARSCVGTCSCGFYGRIASALIAAKEQGFVPTNTEDNG